MVHATRLFAAADPYRREIPPHMTIAEFISLDESVALERSLVGRAIEGFWQCDEVVYAIPDDDFAFYEASRFQLGRRQRT